MLMDGGWLLMRNGGMTIARGVKFIIGPSRKRRTMLPMVPGVRMRAVMVRRLCVRRVVRGDMLCGIVRGVCWMRSLFLLMILRGVKLVWDRLSTDYRFMRLLVGMIHKQHR